MMAAASIVISLYLRFGNNFSESYGFLVPSVLLFTSVSAGVFHFMGLYKGIWRYASLKDLVNITKAVTLATLIFLPLLFMMTRLEDFPRSVLVINWLVLLAALGGPRIFYRMLKDKSISFDILDSGEDRRISVLLVGISDSAINFIRETSNKNKSDYRVVGIVDNDNKKKGRSIHGIKIYGNINAIPEILKKLKSEGNSPQRIILAKDYLNKAIVNKLLKMAEKLGFTLAKLPKISDFKDSVDKVEIKPIAIEDLLGRAQNAPSLGRREELIEGKKILVTGAGGTIGSELVRQIAKYNPKSLILLEISEYNLYKISKELEDDLPSLSHRALIGDIRNLSLLESVFAEYKPEIIFHAAALKHVPIVEENLIEAAMTNIIGSKNIADMCLKHRAEKMIMVSTDKAVNPTSLMGVTKRVAECYVQSLGNSKKSGNTIFSTVRFGNVLGSSGSVIPLFQRQLEQGGPITVTHPDMVRYFMTVPEAVELILQASTIDSSETNKPSSVFVLDMGDPIHIKDLATQMITLAGLRPEIDVKIKYTGIRPGEKLYEELFYENEIKQKTIYESIMLAEARSIDFGSISLNVEKIYKACMSMDDKSLLVLLSTIVPEYISTNDLKSEAA